MPPVERKFYALGCWLLGRCHELGRGADKARDEARQLQHYLGPFLTVPFSALSATPHAV